MKSIFKGKVVKYRKSCYWEPEEYKKYLLESKEDKYYSYYTEKLVKLTEPKLYTYQELVERRKIHETDKFATIIKDDYIEVNDEIYRIEKSYFNQDGAVVYYLDNIIEVIEDDELKQKNAEEVVKYTHALIEQKEIQNEIERKNTKKLEDKNKYVVPDDTINDPNDFGKTDFWSRLFKKIFK